MENLNADTKKKHRQPTIEWIGVRPEPKSIGIVIRKYGKRYDLKISQLEVALEQANDNHPDGWKPRDKKKDAGEKAPLFHNFIYRSWPDISQAATMDIVCEAFVALLSKEKRYNSDEIKAIQKRLKEEIRAIYNGQATVVIANIASGVALQYNFETFDSEYALLVGKNLAAFSSLTEWDILFWDELTTWNDSQCKKVYVDWKKYKADYQAIVNPAFQQWVALRSKNYSESTRKGRKGNPKPSKKFMSQIQRLSSNEARSVQYVLDRLKKRTGSTEGKKYPLAPPMEIDLLILFKYFLPDEMRNRYIEGIQKEQQKTAGDN